MLHLHLTQSLSLTPTILQGIGLLSLSSLELEQKIRQLVSENPFLCIAENPAKESHAPYRTEDSDPWDNVVSPISLKDHLLWQWGLESASDIENLIAQFLIDSTQDDGYLSTPISAIHQSLQDEGLTVSLPDIQRVQHRLQHFDPLGVVSSSLSESLQIQAAVLWGTHGLYPKLYTLIQNHLSLVAQKAFATLSELLEISHSEVKQVIHLLRTLQPKPGLVFHHPTPPTQSPDAFVFQKNGQWSVVLNGETEPRLMMPQISDSLEKHLQGKERQQYKEALGWIQNLEFRQNTLQKTLETVLSYQARFLDEGPLALKPLTLSTIAPLIPCHVSTLSRITTQKTIHTPHGIFPLKKFFLHALPGSIHTFYHIQRALKECISSENPMKPLSDFQLQRQLAQKNIRITRRTVAKYRQKLGISSSWDRRSFL